MRLSSLKEVYKNEEKQKEMAETNEKKPEAVFAEGEWRHFPSRARHSPDFIIMINNDDDPNDDHDDYDDDDD